MSDLQKQIADALQALAARHGIASQPARVENGAAQVQRANRQPAVIDQRDSLARLRAVSAPRVTPRNAVSKGERDLEGRYATVAFEDGTTAVYIDTVEKRSTGVKAYVLRLDNRTRCYVLLALLTDVRDEQ